MSDKTTDTTPDPVAEMRAAAEARLAAIDTKAAAPKAAPEPKVPVEAPKETADKASPPDGAEKPVETTKAVDVEWLPENLRSKATNLDPELSAYLKAGHLRRGEHSRTMKAMDEERKQIEAIKAKAGLWERLEANPEVAAAAYKMLNGEAAPTATPEADEEIPDPIVDPKGYAKWLRGEVTKDLESKAAKVVEDRVFAPKSEEEAIRAACLEWAEDNHVSDNATLAAISAEADAIAKELGLRFTPESTPKILSRAYKALGIKAPTNGASNGTGNGGLLKVASPSSRGSTAVAPTGVPAFVRNGALPRTDEERIEYAAYLARERLGMKTSSEDIRSLFGGRGIPSR